MSNNVDLIKLLNKMRTNENNFNIISIGGPNFPTGKFYVSKSNLTKFLSSYNHFINIKGKQAHLLEPPFSSLNKPFLNSKNENCNLIKIDIDIKYTLLDDKPKDEQLKHRYKKEHIKTLVNIYINCLNEYLDLDDQIKNIEFYLLERSTGYISKGKNNQNSVKDGIHIIVPYYLINNVILHQVRKDVIEHPDFISLYNEINQENSIHDFLDESVVSKNSWFMYGSGKPFTQPYLVTNIYKFKKYNTKNNVKTIKYISIDKSELSNIVENKLELTKKLFLNSAKIELKPNNKTNITKLEQELESQGFTNNNFIDNGIHSNVFGNSNNITFKQPTSSIELNTLKLFVNCFKQERCENYKDWWTIGQALYNIDWQKGFITWIHFSQKCQDKFNPEVCKTKWDEFKTNYMNCKYQYNLNYIKNLAKQDNIVEFKKIYQYLKMNILNDIVDTFRQPIYAKKIGDSTLSKKMAEYIKADAETYFVAIDNNMWYYYQGHRWIISKDGVEIKKYLKNKILPIFISYHTKCMDLNKQLQNENERINMQNSLTQSQQSSMDSMMNLSVNEIANNINLMENNRNTTQENTLKQSVNEERIKTALRIVTYLENSTNRNTLVKELCTEFFDPHFYSNLDCNPNVIHCTNGIFDLNECKFRDGVPDDMITITSNNIYIDNEQRYTDLSYVKEEAEFNDFIDKLFPDYEVKEFILNNFAISLSGKSLIQTFNVCTGSGSNGKSVLFDFLENVFGEYFSSASPALLTKGRSDANNASPAIANLRGKRVICCSEPDEKEPIKTGVMKELTGGDKLIGRHLHMSPIEFRPQHSIFFACNDPPEVQTTDEGTWRRIRIIPFISKFVDPDSPLLVGKKVGHFYVKNPNIKEKFNTWKPIFLNELINRYIELKDSKFSIETPEQIKIANNEYKKEHNIYESFKNECLRKSAEERLYANEAFEVFQENSKQNNQKINKINKNVFVTEMNRVIGKIKGGGKYWKGWSIIIPCDSTEFDDDNDNNTNSECESNSESDLEQENEESNA